MVAIMDPPGTQTGFGTVASAILPALSKEFDITLFATGGYGDKTLSLPMAKYGVKDFQPTPEGNAHAYNLLDEVFNARNVDCTFIYKDTGSVCEFMDKTHLSFYPSAAYLVTEGAPINNVWKRLYKDLAYERRQAVKDWTIDAPVVSSKFDAAEVLKQTGVEVAVGYHGSNHGKWRKFTKEEKAALRVQLSAVIKQEDLNDHFLFMYVARNADRKMWPRLFQIMKLVKDKRPDLKFKLIAYTKAFDMYKQNGWNLPEIAFNVGLSEFDIIYPVRSADDITGGATVDDDIASGVPSMLKWYNTADAYIHPAGGEACGLPLLEAARCGLPVLTTKYAGGWEYAEKFAMPLEVSDWIVDKTDLNWALVDKEDAANKMIKLMENKAIQAEYSNKSLKYCNYLWEDLGNVCLEASMTAMEKYKWRH